jgi:hypothetical protein
MTIDSGSRSLRLFVVLTGFFIANALMAQFVGIKIFALEPTLGLEPFNWNLFGQTGSLSFTAGVLLWPVVFVMTDVINEYYGKRGVRLVSFLAVGLILYAFVFVWFAIAVTPAEWWVASGRPMGVPDMQAAFALIFGQGLWVVIGSVTAFLIGQLVDVLVFHRVRRITGERLIWLRATGSTVVSQFIDSYIVLYIAFVLGPAQWPVDLFLAVGTVNYGYKFVVAVLMTPLIYLAHRLIDRYLGHADADLLKATAAAGR